MAVAAITHDLYDDGSEAVDTYKDLDTLVATAFPTDGVALIPNDGRTSFFFRNVGATSTTTIVLEGQKTPEGAVVDDVTYTAQIGDTVTQYVYVGPKNKNLFNTGQYVQFTAQTPTKALDLKYAAVRHLKRG